MKKAFYFFIVQFFALIFLSAAENSQHKIYTANLPTQGETEVFINLGDEILIFIPKDCATITGFELSIKSSQALVNIPNSVEYTFYYIDENIDGNNSSTLQKRTVFKDNFPQKINHTIQVPFSTDNNLKNSAFTTVLPAIDRDRNIYFSLKLKKNENQEKLSKTKFELTLKPILVKNGFLTINFAYPNNEKHPFNLEIDDIDVTNNTMPITLLAGVHHIVVSSDYYCTEVRNVIIEQAQNQNIEIKLIGITPSLMINIPNNSTLYIDSKYIKVPPSKTVQLEEGKHVLRIVMGDYEITKTLNVHNGKNYILDTVLDMSFIEKPVSTR